MKEKLKKTCKYLNYVEHVLILASEVTGCVPISAVTFLQLKTISQLSRKRRKSIIKKCC